MTNYHEERPLVIIGASGLGKEVAWLARRLGRKVRGFIDDDPVLQDGSFYGYPVLGTLSAWPEHTDAAFVIAIAAPRVKKKILGKMQGESEPAFAVLIDPAASIETDITQIGCGTIICAGSVVTADVVIGNHCLINKLCSIGHDVTLDDYVTLAPKVMLGGHVHLEPGVEIGAAAAVRQEVRIETGAMIGMGSVVLKNVQSNAVMVGSPVVQLKTLKAFQP